MTKRSKEFQQRWTADKLPYRRLLWMVGVALILFMTACTTGALSIDVKVTLYRDEKWKAEAQVIYSSQQIQLMGPQIEQGLGMQISQWQAQGIRASMSQKTLKNGNVLFVINAQGDGYAQLNNAIFDGMAQIQSDPTSDPPRVTFSYAPYGSFFSLALSRKLTLQGGEIISSNGSVSGKSVTWYNPLDTMQATLALSPALNLGLVLGVLGAGVGLILIFGVARKAGKKRCWNCNTKISRNAEFCPECGTEIF